jgi:hypothetical protein
VGADAFTIMRLAGHSSVTVTQRYVHPTRESMERAFDRLEALNRKAMERKRCRVPTKLPTPPCEHLVSIEGPVAQRLEQGTHNPLAGGSNPSGPTII